MPVKLLPDAEALIGTYLRQHPDVQALGARVIGRTPKDTSEPWVRIQQFDNPAVGDSRTEHLIAWFGQFDCYAGKVGGQEEASLLTRTVRGALAVMHEASHDGAVVTGVRFVSCPRIPDEDFEPARERYLLSAEVFLHAVSA